MSPSVADPGPVRVLLVDDDPLVCSGLTLILASSGTIDVVAAVHDGDEVVPAIHRHTPQVVLMDLRMRRLDGITATGEVVRLPTPPQVLVLTTFEDDDAVLRAVQAGASGFLLKTAGPEEIIHAVRNVAAGEAAISPRSARHLFQHVSNDPATDARRAAATAVAALTPREQDVAIAVARGGSNAAVSRHLYFSEATVKTHLASAQAKLGCSNRVEVAVLVERAGLLHGRPVSGTAG